MGCATCDAAGQYYARACTAGLNSLCGTCSSCGTGEYRTQDCFQGGLASAGWGGACQTCSTCVAGETFMRRACGAREDTLCVGCSQCGGVVKTPCGAEVDTECPHTSECREDVVDNETFVEYDWMPGRCRQGQYVTSVSTAGVECAACPEYLWGPNGLWCERCPGFREPYFDASSCVCAANTQPVAGSHNCSCGLGYSFGDLGCLECSEGFYNDVVLELGEAWYDQTGKSCLECPAGTWSGSRSSGCYKCAFGQFSLGGAGWCSNCSQTGYFAQSASDEASCVACNSTCEVGWYPTPCPFYAGSDLFLCLPCPDTPSNATRNPPQNARAGSACDWRCDAGFYKFDGTCLECNASACEPGYNRSTCTDGLDSNCDEACVDAAKPEYNSQWTVGCQWACLEGYEYQVQDYYMFQLYSCVLRGAVGVYTWS